MSPAITATATGQTDERRELAKANAEEDGEEPERGKPVRHGSTGAAADGAQGKDGSCRKCSYGMVWLKRSRLGWRSRLRATRATCGCWSWFLAGTTLLDAMRTLHLGSCLGRRLKHGATPAARRRHEER